MYDIAKTIEAFCEAIKGLFSYAEVCKIKQCETDVLETKKGLQRKETKQEDLILDMAVLIRKYMPLYSRTDKIRAKIYLNRIKKVN